MSKDNFSHDSSNYQRFRPVYPAELYRQIGQMTNDHERAWDVATGNGQVARELATMFREVEATDISQSQLQQAPQLSNINYQVAAAEENLFPDHHFDLITVAQALHWFDFDRFFRQAQRVLRPDGLLVAWGYALLRISPSLDPIIDHFYEQVVGPYWDEERRHVDRHYNSIPITWTELIFPGEWGIEARFSLRDLLGYLRTWSSVRHFQQAHQSDPVAGIEQELTAHWGEAEYQAVRFPLFVRAGHWS